ncbi:MAG: DUF465 domain-containing protein [Rhodospirillaceae bacterium]
MTDQEQVDELKTKHHDLDEQIDKENARPNPDDIAISELKKEKLKIKDELASMDAL